ncbi:hypothetical protein EVAR_23869_1 [Eumeta japonica]|uniref:Uncharacterized protein n=1 Tax=Eumeta variegata TaxID=151549 RepID=A0A4C1V522_EUMVA|nr:hypothetical protein EVAR_23869_1 [Eumeta japonica]
MAALLTGRQRNIPTQLRLSSQDVKLKSCSGTWAYTSPRLRKIPRPVLTSRLPTRTKLAIYNCYIHSCLTYAAPARYTLYSDQQRQRLQTQKNLMLRMIAGADRLGACSIMQMRTRYHRSTTWRLSTRDRLVDTNSLET